MTLLIKDNAADTGTQPSSPPNWLSPDIFITNGVDPGTVKVGQTVTLNARVWNIGNAPTSKVKVQVWVSDYTTLPNPAFTALNLSGTTNTAVGSFPSIPAGGNQVISCDPQWTVTAGQDTQFNGHVCLVANCYLDDGTEGSEGSPGSNPFFVAPNGTDIATNPRHAQRNIAIQPAAGLGGQIKVVKVAINAVNPDLRHERPIRLQMTHVTGKAALTPIEREHIRIGKFRDLKPAISRFKVLKFGMIDHCGELSRPIELRGAPAQEARFDLGPRSKVPIHLVAELNPREPVGNLHTFDIVQLNERGAILGGARLLVVVAKSRGAERGKDPVRA